MTPPRPLRRASSGSRRGCRTPRRRRSRRGCACTRRLRARRCRGCAMAMPALRYARSTPPSSATQCANAASVSAASRHVGGDRSSATSSATGARRRRRGRRQQTRMPRVGETERSRPTDSGGRAGHERGAPLEIHRRDATAQPPAGSRSPRVRSAARILGSEHFSNGLARAFRPQPSRRSSTR